MKYYIIVYPDDLVAKVYKLDGKEYDKIGDFSEISYGLKIDFKRVFKCFR